jgi:hypothetical protein
MILEFSGGITYAVSFAYLIICPKVWMLLGALLVVSSRGLFAF